MSKSCTVGRFFLSLNQKLTTCQIKLLNDAANRCQMLQPRVKESPPMVWLSDLLYTRQRRNWILRIFLAHQGQPNYIQPSNYDVFDVLCLFIGLTFFSHNSELTYGLAIIKWSNSYVLQSLWYPLGTSHEAKIREADNLVNNSGTPSAWYQVASNPRQW